MIDFSNLSVPDSKLVGNQIIANQQIFLRNQTQYQATKLLWVIHNLNDNLSQDEFGMSRSLRSCIFATQDKQNWMLELRATKPNFNAHLVVHAIGNMDEEFKPRKLLIQPTWQKHIEPKQIPKYREMEEAFFTEVKKEFVYE